MSGNKFGTVRVYDFRDDSFESGSWVFLVNSPYDMAVKADLICRDFAFEFLNAKYCRSEVLKANKKVVRYQLDYKPTLINEDDLKFYFILSKENFTIQKNKLIKLLELDIIE